GAAGAEALGDAVDEEAVGPPAGVVVDGDEPAAGPGPVVLDVESPDLPHPRRQLDLTGHPAPVPVPHGGKDRDRLVLGDQPDAAAGLGPRGYAGHLGEPGGVDGHRLEAGGHAVAEAAVDAALAGRQARHRLAAVDTLVVHGLEQGAEDAAAPVGR